MTAHLYYDQGCATRTTKCYVVYNRGQSIIISLFLLLLDDILGRSLDDTCEEYVATCTNI